jgi:hypothetical protein
MNDELHVLTVLPNEVAPIVHWMEGYLDPRTRLDAVEKRKSLTQPEI